MQHETTAPTSRSAVRANRTGLASPIPDSSLIHLHASGVSIVVDVSSSVPSVVHWGAYLGQLRAEELEALRVSSVPARLAVSPDVPRFLSIIPTEVEGWAGTPGLSVSKAGVQLAPRMTTANVGTSTDERGAQVLSLLMVDATNDFEVTVGLALLPSGIFEMKSEIRSVSIAKDTLDVAALTQVLPLPARAEELLDFSGKWIRERSPQRASITFGTHRRDAKRGKPGLDSPYLFLAGTPGFSSRTGEAWGMHVAWSGDQQWFVEKLPEGAGAFTSALGGGEALRTGEIRLGFNETYATPRVLYTWSDRGIDGVSDRFHEYLRARPEHPSEPRPLVLNSWEAVYFDHTIESLVTLVDCAAEVGVERFVLDDGWFHGRHDDTAGLGDWTVDRTKWPAGLRPLVDRVRSHGMQFGLWVEPEMINLDSDLGRDHADWLLAPSATLGPSSRNQYVLNIAIPDAWEYLHSAISSLVSEYAIDFLKWDHNRDLLEPMQRTFDGDRPGVHAQTVALYRLLEVLRLEHPTLEIETCASGGGRVDLEILERTQRVWTSDCNDPIERQSIQRWTTALIPPELMGSHVGEARAHTTNRVTDMSFRLATALFAHAGLEWDITTCSAEEIDLLKRWSSMYREFRDLVHTGRQIHADLVGDAAVLHGVVSQDRTWAIFEWAQLTTTPLGQTGRVLIPGVDPLRSYQIRVREDLGAPSFNEAAGPVWYEDARKGWVDIHGSVLVAAGLPMPSLNPAQSALLELVAK